METVLCDLTVGSFVAYRNLGATAEAFDDWLVDIGIIQFETVGYCKMFAR